MPSLRVALALIWLFGVAAAAHAQGPRRGFTTLDLIVDKAIFTEVCKALELSDAQQSAAERHFESYSNRILALDRRAHEEIESRAMREWREVSAEAAKRGEMMTDEEMRPLNFEVNRLVLQYNQEGETVLEDFLHELGVMLAESQQSGFERVPRIIRRRNLIHDGVDQPWGDFDRPLDVFDLVDKASQHELRWIFDAEADADDAGDDGQILGRARAKVRELLDEHEKSLDELVKKHYEVKRHVPHPDDPAILHHDDPRLHERIQRSISAWRHRYELQAPVVDRIAELTAEIVDEATAEAWRHRWLTALCPDLMAPRWPDGMADWLREQEDVSPEQTDAASALLEEYQMERQLLRQLAIELGVQSKKHYVSAFGDSPQHKAYARALVRMNTLSLRTIERLGSILYPGPQREAFDAMATRLYPDDVGPTVWSDALEALGVDPASIHPRTFWSGVADGEPVEIRFEFSPVED